MTERKHPLAECERCPLYDAKGPVMGAGPEGAVRVAVVGEAPGFVEATTGRPFAGPSGQVLNELLRNNDIRREDVYVTQAVMCRPDRDSATPPEAIDACRPRLYDELVDKNPDYTLAMGAVAAKSLGLKGAMSKLRVGPPKKVTIMAEDDDPYHLQVIPTWHPAYAMRLPDALPSIDLDISKINKGATAHVYEEPIITVIEDQQEAYDALYELWDMPGPFAVDIETGFEKDDLDVHADRRPLLCVGVAYERGKVAIFGESLMDNMPFLASLGELFVKKPLIFHNGKSDVAGLFPVMGAVNMVYDTMLEHYSLDERTGGHGLGVLGIEMLGTPDWKSWTKPYLAKGKEKNFADIPRDLLYRYNAIDCDVTYRLHERFWGELTWQGRTKLPSETLVPAANQLVYPEMDGLVFDMPYSQELASKLAEQLATLRTKIAEYIGREINPGSWQQLLVLFDEREWYIPTKKGKPSTGAPELQRAREEGKYDDEAEGFLDLLFEYRDLAKDDGTFCRGMQKQAELHEDGLHRIHTTFTLHVTTTGRLSSRDPNLQNVKDKQYLRRQFIAEPGNTFLQGDYSQVEGRVMAVLSGDQYLGDLFRNKDRDIFDELSVAMYGKLIKEKRRLLKTFFYGIAYERTAHGISEGFNIPLDEATLQLNQFKSLIPGVELWQDEVWAMVEDQGYLETSFGRRRHFPLITNRNKADIRRDAMAFLPQSTASDICLRAFTRLRPALAEKYGDAVQIRLSIHDAIVVECPMDLVEEVQIFMSLYMTYSGDEWAREQGSDVPFQVAFKSGTSWDQLD